MISDENVAARPAESPPENDPWPAIMADPQLANARRKLSIHEIRLIIAHVRRADAPEIAAAEIRGLEMTKEIAKAFAARESSDANQGNWFARGEINAANVIKSSIDARIAELKAKTEPGK